MLIKILSRFSLEVIFECEADSLTAAVKIAVEKKANLYGANLERANLYGANLERANLERANLERANLERANLSGANLTGASLSGANLTGANLTGASLERANLYGASLYGANLERANLSGANLSGANLYGANLERANLTGANLTGASLERADLYGASLYGANLERANLERANLYGANLERANLYGANLERANLERANLTGASLERANLSGASLERANLERANLSGADLTGASLYGANLERANDLSPIRNDVWLVLASAPMEVHGLRNALIAGKIDGTQYAGQCACLVGTLAKVRHCDYNAIPGLRPNSNRPAERLFMNIRPGHTPENCKYAKLALEWIDSWSPLQVVEQLNAANAQIEKMKAEASANVAKVEAAQRYIDACKDLSQEFQPSIAV